MSIVFKITLEVEMPHYTAIVLKKAAFFSQRLIAATFACAFWMTQGDLRLLTPRHWLIALQTAFFSATILMIISFTKFQLLQKGLLKKLVTTSVIVAIVDHFVHPSHFGGDYGEGLATGITTAALVGLIGLVMSAFSWPRISA